MNHVCKHCQKEIKLMCRIGTDYCCEVCEKLARQNDNITIRDNWIKK